MRRLALLALLACAACPRQLPLRFGPEGEVHDPLVLWHVLERRSARLQSLSAGARVTVHGPHGGTTGVEIAARKPAFLRVEVDGFFGNPVALLATDGRTLQILRVDQGVFAEGAATAANLAQVLPAALPPAELVSLLLGDPIGGGERWLGHPWLAVDPARRAYALKLFPADAEGAARTVFLDTETLFPVESIESMPEYQVWFRDPETVAGLAFPSSLELKLPGADIEIHYKDVQLDPALDDQLFRLAPPPGVRRVPLEG